MGLSDELSKLSELRDKGVISEEEFAAGKARLLGKSESTPIQSFTQDASKPETTGQTGTPVNRPPRPSNHLAGAILATLFCCLPLGIVAIVKAAGVNSAYESGRFEEAQRLSKEASSWVGWSGGIGVIVLFIWIIAMLIG